MSRSVSPKHKKAPSISQRFFIHSLISFGYFLENFRTFLFTRPIILKLMYRDRPVVYRRYIFTLLIFGIALFIHYLIQIYFTEDILLNKNISIVIFLFGVIISAWYGGFGAGLFAMLLSVVTLVTFGLTPEQIMTFTDGKDQLRIGFFIILSILISVLQETVQEATRWHSLILESISDIFITFDRNMRFMYVNKKAEEIFHLERVDVLGRRLTDVYPNARKMLFYKNCLEAFAKQKKIRFEMRLEEDRRWYAVSLYPSVDGISAYFQDITRRKRIEARLRESQLQFQRLFDANIIGIFTADAEGNVYQANDLFLQTVGYSRSDLKNRRVNWKKMTPPEYQEISDRTNREVLKKGMSPPFEKEYIRKDGTRVNILMGKVLLNKTTGTILTFNLNITEQKNLEKRKNEFISIASHELKTPLTTIKAFTQILLKQMSGQKERRPKYFLTNIDNQVNKLNSLIADLLDVSKIEAGKLSLQLNDVVLGDLVKKVIIDAQYTIQSHTIVKEGESKKMIKGDAHRLEQVLINLISNAVKYSPQADKIIVRITEKRHVVVVGVQDFGMGIVDEEQTKIFERFFRSEHHIPSDVTGFGLGLYIAKEIIDRHGGRLWVESKLGKGSTFSFSLPIVKEKFREKKKINAAL